jgi:hypothetical protein
VENGNVLSCILKRLLRRPTISSWTLRWIVLVVQFEIGSLEVELHSGLVIWHTITEGGANRRDESRR